MADLSLAQGLIAAATPRGVATDIFEKQRQQGERAFKAGQAFGQQVAGPLAQNILTGEYDPDPERFQLLQELVKQDPKRFGKAQARFEDFLKLRDQGKKVKVVSPDFTRNQKAIETAARNEAKLARAGERMKARREEILAKYPADLEQRIAEEEAFIKAPFKGGDPQTVSDFRRAKRDVRKLKKMMTKRDEELNKIDEMLSQQARGGQLEPFTGPQEIEETREASRADLRAARRALNRELPGKSALRQLIATGQQAGRGVPPGAGTDAFKILDAYGKINESIKKASIAPELTRIEGQVGATPRSRAFKTTANAAVETLTTPDVGNALGGLFKIRAIAGDFVQNLATYTHDTKEAERVAIGAFNEAAADIQKRNNDIKKDVLSNKISSEAGIMRMFINLSMAKTLAIPDQALDKISEYSSPALLANISKGNPFLSRDPEHMRNISKITRANLDKADQKKIEQSRKQYESILSGIAQDLQVGDASGKYKIDYKGDIFKLDINKDMDKVLYETLTKGVLGKFAPVNERDYEQGLKERGEVWHWLRSLAYFGGFVTDYRAFNDDAAMERLIRTHIPWKVISNQTYLKGFGGKLRRRFNKAINKANSNALENNPSLWKSTKAGAGAFLGAVKDVIDQTTGR